jgi:hypothetical protein
MKHENDRAPNPTSVGGSTSLSVLTAAFVKVEPTALHGAVRSGHSFGDNALLIVALMVAFCVVAETIVGW